MTDDILTELIAGIVAARADGDGIGLGVVMTGLVHIRNSKE